jgi:uncharacterized protein (DUF2249 family)
MMAAETLDLRDVPPPERHGKIFDAFDADNYEVEQRGEQEFVATLSKK